MEPKNPTGAFCSAKLALRAVAASSTELRFWPIRPANLPEPEDCVVGWFRVSGLLV